ncbi:hypothetical protein D9757_013954 [Collybiopsis confluens]|uniref:Uncharacterized protein n=1 Tax=Collybiopsis confluens TaxID=2823264 RepID=A0A8H5G626_9AGAR|nr:hypothetical protein D9757_013954 [Collybiopsis confluens]
MQPLSSLFGRIRSMFTASSQNGPNPSEFKFAPHSFPPQLPDTKTDPVWQPPNPYYSYPWPFQPPPPAQPLPDIFRTSHTSLKSTGTSRKRHSRAHRSQPTKSVHFERANRKSKLSRSPILNLSSDPDSSSESNGDSASTAQKTSNGDSDSMAKKPPNADGNSDSTAQKTTGNSIPFSSGVPSTDSNFVNSETQYVQLKDMAKWNCWPQGNWYMDITFEEFEKTEELAVHWACRNAGGRQIRGSSPSALTIDQGQRSTRRCYGYIECTNQKCAIIIRPNTQTRDKRMAQLTKKCSCGIGDLVHVECRNASRIVRWAGGVRYYNGTQSHHHPQPPTVHLTRDERSKLTKLVTANPKATPAALISGNTIDKSSTATISDVLLHSGRVGRYRSQILGNTTAKSGDDFIEDFMEFQRENAGFIVANTMLEGVAVISAQTPFMASQLHSEALAIDGPFNGIVSDAAHDWWKVRNSLLLVSSIFSPILQRWIPALFSYSNGATATHFQYHFLVLMESIASNVLDREKEVADELFAGVVDFSQAERNGFIEAFLLKGCWQHFSSSITRVKRITAIVPVGSRSHFDRLAKSLKDATPTNFERICKHIRSEFPKLGEWINWWLHPDHAKMLFESRREMPSDLWRALPDTTNAEEAMHFSMYSQQGRKHDFLEGWKAIAKIVETFQRKFNAAQIGQPLYWGKAALQTRNELKARIGRTKISRTKAKIRAKKGRYFNDGRPKDDHRLLRLQQSHSTSAPNIQSEHRKSRNKAQMASANIPLTHQTTHQKQGPMERYKQKQIKFNDKYNDSKCNGSESDDHEYEEWNGIQFSNKDAKVHQIRRYARASHLPARQNSSSSPPSNSQPTDHLSMANPLSGYSKNDLRVANAPRDFTIDGGNLVISKTFTSLQSYIHCWNNVAALFDGQTSHRFYPVFKALEARHLLLVGNPVEPDTFVAELAAQREGLREYIKVLLNAEDDLYGWDTAFSWVTECLDISHMLRKAKKNQISKHEWSIYLFFGVECITIRRCTGHLSVTTTDGSNCTHVQLKPPSPGPSNRCTGGPPAEQWSIFGGKFQAWVQSHTDMNSLHHQKVARCWRVNNTQCFCSGSAHAVDIFTSLPLLWIVDQDVTNKNPKLWNYPQKLFPTKNKAAQGNGVVYEMIGRVFFNGSHFVARYVVSTNTAQKQRAVFFYDGMKEKGRAQREQGGMDTLLGGISPPLPNGYGHYKTYAVIYWLKGGKNAQDWFKNDQQTLVARHLSIEYQPVLLSGSSLRLPKSTFTDSNFKEIPLSECRWFSGALLEQFRSQVICPIEYERIGSPPKLDVRAIPGPESLHSSSPSCRSTSDSGSDYHSALAAPNKAVSPLSFATKHVPADNPNQHPFGSHLLFAKPTSSINVKKEESDTEADSSFSIPDRKTRTQSSNLQEFDSIIEDLIRDSPLPLSEDSRIPSSSPPPNSPLHIICRCGQEADGHRQETKETLIRCDLCKKYWSHRACQTYRNTHDIHNFICPMCGTQWPAKLKELQEKVVKKRTSTRSAAASPQAISGRLFDGKGVLVKDGTFYYPARLLHKLRDNRWAFRWWRHNEPEENTLQVPGSNGIAPIEHIVDELWLNRSARRKIRLGFWKRACLVDGEADSRSLEYLKPTSEIDQALRPHKDILTRLMLNPKSVKERIPAREWIRESKRTLKAIPLTGGLTCDDCTRINSWFTEKIPQAKGKEHLRVDALPIAHARTLVLVHRHQEEFTENTDVGDSGGVVQRAFDRLNEWTGKSIDGKDKLFEACDVDLEALRILERLIFDISASAGEAGNQQWGLDAGAHQQNWNPWAVHGPEQDAPNRREATDDETEIQV